MPRRPTQSAPYKDVTLGQLRSFCETARQGSFTAAAESLGLAHPTVWKQVHALETNFGQKLVEPHFRGCRLTEAGDVLLRLMAPSVFDLNDLHRRFDEELRRIPVRIKVVAPPRLLEDDLVPCLESYFTEYPQVQLTLSDARTFEIEEAIESGQAELGFTTALGSGSSLLTVEPWYELDVLLITSKVHSLAKLKSVSPEDLRGAALLNSRQTLLDPMVHAAIERHGLFDAESRLVEARQTGLLFRLVERNLGVALVLGKAGLKQPSLHVRVMSRYFGRSRISLIRRRGVRHHPAVAALAEAVRRHVSGQR